MTLDPARVCTRISSAELTEADPTPGMTRRLAAHEDDMWSGLVDTEGHAASGWHHHGDHDTTLYVIRGQVRLECGPAGETVLNAGPGDFLRVPAGAIHRESNPGDEPSQMVVVRCGSGEPTINTDGPAR